MTLRIIRAVACGLHSAASFPVTATPGLVRSCRVLAVVATLVVAFAGCQSGLGLGRRDDQLVSTRNVRGPLERLLARNGANGELSEGAIREGLRDLERADRFAEADRTRQAVRTWKRVAKRYRETAVGEEAQFKLAEMHFAQERYALAQDAYGELFKTWPSTRYTDEATRRMFAIAQVWLGAPELVTSNDIRQASVDESGKLVAELPQSDNTTGSRDPTLRIPLLPNFHDRRRPVFDTSGRALEALRSIWLNDPTGPLADDALMLSASYYLRRGDFIESDRFFQILREEYPNSPHLENAFVLGSHVKLMSYQGPEYNGASLDDARKLKESSLRLFPGNKHRTQLREELQIVYAAQAQRDWELARYYHERKHNHRAAAIYYQQVIERFPTSSYATRARELLAKIDSSAVSGLPGFSGLTGADLRPVPDEDIDAVAEESL